MRKSARLLPLALRATTQSASVQLNELQGGLIPAGVALRPLFWSASKSLFGTLSSAPASEDENSTEFRDKLRKVAQVAQLHQDLKHESAFHDIIPSEVLIHLILDRGAASDEKEATELIQAMQSSGVVLMHNKHVYLKPLDLAEHRLPDFLDLNGLKAKLEVIDQQLQPYEKLHQQAEKNAWRWLYVGCFVVVVQLAAFLRLTYYELSWDVMEPIGYMISLFYTLMGYLFFIYTRGHPFDLHPVKEWQIKKLKAERLASIGGPELDEERYEALVKARDRYAKRFKFLQKLESKQAAAAT